MNDVSIINIRTNSKLKREAQATAKALGLNLSGILNAYLHQLVRTRKVNFDLTETPTDYFNQTISASAQDRKMKDVSPIFEESSDAISWLRDSE